MSASVMALQIALGLGMVGLAVSVLFMRNLMASAVALAGFSLLLALEFYVLQAPDVAIAEAGIGAGLTTYIKAGWWNERRHSIPFCRWCSVI